MSLRRVRMADHRPPIRRFFAAYARCMNDALKTPPEGGRQGRGRHSRLLVEARPGADQFPPLLMPGRRIDSLRGSLGATTESGGRAGLQRAVFTEVG